MNEKAVITNIGVVNALGIGKKEFWSNLKERKGGITKLSLLNAKEYSCKFAGQVKEIDFNKYFSKIDSKYLPRAAKLILLAAELALKESGIGSEVKDNTEIGIVVGIIFGNLSSQVNFIKTNLKEGPDSVSPIEFPNTLANSLAGQIAIKHGIKGMNATISSGFPSSLDAVGYSAQMLKRSTEKLILCCGAEPLSEENHQRFSKLGLLSDTYRLGLHKGMFLGEGSAVLIIEKENFALQRKADIIAEISGWGRSFGNTSEDLKDAMDKALSRSNLGSNDIECLYVNANGNSELDEMERKAVSDIYMNNQHLTVASLKPVIGECYSAGGIMHCVASCLSFVYNCIPFTYSFDNGFIWRLENRKMDNIMINSFDPHGNNTSLVLKRYS